MSDAGVNDDPAGVPRVGIIGGGQLARTIAQAAGCAGLEVSALADATAEGAHGVCA